MQVFPLLCLVYGEGIDFTEPNNKGKLITCSLFDVDETKALSDAATVMEKAFSNMARSIAVHDAYKEFREELEKLKTGDNYNIAKVDRKFRAYVMEFKLFLDHWTKYISDLKKTDKEYGTVYARLYKDVTTEAYDNCEEYAIATVLRNYVVHAYDSIDHIYVDGEKNKAYVLRDNLLRIHVSASAKSIIQKQPEMIDLVYIAEKSLEALEKVQEKLIGYQFTDDTVNAAITLLSAKKRIDEAGIKSNFWMLVEVQEPKQVLDYKNGIIMQRVKDLQGNPVQDEKRVLPLIRHGVDIGYKNLNWDGYLATACYVKSLWEKGYWEELQNKYG